MIKYLASSAKGQAQLFLDRVPLSEAIADPSTTPQTRAKLELVQAARDFAEGELGLRSTSNYRHYVDLRRPFVTWVVSRAPRNRLEHIKFWYPVVGSMPYKGFFDEQAAQEEAAHWRERGEDVYVRGVSAYSTLGWFKDPILSSMLRMSEFDLVDTVIHETVHATVFIKNQSDFNERLATFLGHKGAELFFLKRDGPDSKELERFRFEGVDQSLFSSFITQELDSLQAWYLAQGEGVTDEQRQARFAEIRSRFEALTPSFKSKGAYSGFLRGEMNNARLMTYRMYLGSLDDFEAAWLQLGGRFSAFLEFSRKLEQSPDPLAELRRVGQSGP
jgi:predicted aminopeptidase